jgi:gluconate:H+ symporter, GntP family
MHSLLLLLIGMALVLGGILGLRLHAFLALIGGAMVIAFLTPENSLKRYVETEMLSKGPASEFDIRLAQEAMAEKTPVKRVVEGFGETCGKVGILIAMASVIGACLLESGAAQRIVQAILAAFGVARAHLAFLFSGFLLAIPVFFDTVFYLLMPIGKAMRRKTGKNYLLYILTIVAGGTMAHSLVPPTPGPLFVAGELGVELPTMMIAGFIVGAFAVTFGYAWAVWQNSRHEITLPDELDLPEGTIEKEAKLPPLVLALLPVILPIIWLAVGSILKVQGNAASFVPLLNDKNLALIAGAVFGLFMLGFYGRADATCKRTKIHEALQSGAGILLITAAGGAFGAVLRQTGIGADIAEMLGSSASWLALPVVFLVTTIVRTAQGSATVAMITAAPVAAAFLPQIMFHPVYLALAIGCGSKPIPWMNDSGFWIITRMSGMKESETLRFVTPMMSLMGLVGLVATLIGAWLFPMT